MLVDQDVKRRVEESRPILQTIYDKVRKKEQMYQVMIADGNQKYESAAGLAREYKEFGHDAVRIINNNIIMQQESIKEHKQCPLVRNYQSAANLKTNCTFNNIIEEYRRSKAEPPLDTVTSQSIYERYRSKLA